MSFRVWLYILTIIFGLWISATEAGGFLSDNTADWPVNIWCWGLFAFILVKADTRERIEMLTVVALATPMELFFSEIWLIYEYERDFMPLFVPAGHYFLFDLGRRGASMIKDNITFIALFPFFPLVGYGVYTGSDTSGVILLILILGFTKWGPQPKLYVVMAWAALAMELWGTYLGVWTWSSEVPWTELTAWNPPLLVGAFYCFGDLLVNISVQKFEINSQFKTNFNTK